MLSQRNPRLRRFDVVVNSFHGCVSDTSKKFSRTPEMSFSEIVSQPRMFLQKSEGGITFKQLQSLANTNGGWHFNKQVDMINSDVELINLKPFSVSNLSYKELAIHLNPIKLHRIHSVFAFPHEVESILSKTMVGTFQIHFLSPIAHANIVFNSGGLVSRPSVFSQKEILNFEGGNSSLGLKTEVPLPRM